MVGYAYNDFVISTLAHALGQFEDERKYIGRSGGLENMFNPTHHSVANSVDTGFKGFLQPRYMNGTFGYQDPLFCSPLFNFTGCCLNPYGRETYEGSIWMYTLYVPGDMAFLTTKLGRKDTFVKRLDWL